MSEMKPATRRSGGAPGGVGARRRGVQGFTLLELVIGLAIFAIVATGVITAIASGVLAGDALQERDAGLIAARGRLESFLSQPYREAGTYTLPSVSPVVTLESSVQSLQGDTLQRLSVVAKSNKDGDTLTLLDTFKANRFVRPDFLPPASGLESVRTVSVPSLRGKTGFFSVVTVVPSAWPGDLRAFWWAEEEDHHHHSHEGVSITIYAGQPFGAAFSGLSALAPLSVPGTVVALAGLNDDHDHDHDRLGVVTRNAAAGRYTIYFYAEDDTREDDKLHHLTQASVTCVCP